MTLEFSKSIRWLNEHACFLMFEPTKLKFFTSKFILSCLLQAWLYAKVEMAREARLNRPDPNIEKQAKEAKESDAQTAYNEWLDIKRKQDKALRQLEEKRREEEASQYAIRDRQLCDEAFKR